MIHTLLALLVSSVLSVHHCNGFLDSDLDHSGRVDVRDLIDLLLCYGQEACDEGDVNRDNVVDVFDLIALLDCFGTTEAVMCNWQTVESIADLNLMREDRGGHFLITESLDFPPDWEPVGTEAFPFHGFLNALPGVTLNNLRVNQPTEHPNHDLGSGLFAWLNGADVRNIHFVEPVVKGGEFVGVLAGYAVAFGRIENVTVTGADVQGDRYTGVLIGQTRAVPIIDCHVFGSVVNAEYNGSYFTGGIAGNMYSVGIISRCSTDVLMFTGWRDHGGIVGQLGGGIIRRSNANVSLGTASNPLRGGLGGIAGGMHNAIIEDCHATGTIFTVSRNGSPSPYTGGIAGYCFNGGQVRDSWCDVTIQYDGDEPSVGAAVGRRGGTWGPWSDVFYDWRSPWPGCGDGYGDGIFPGPQ